MRNLSKFISLCSYFPHLPHLDLLAGLLSRSEVSRQISTGANAPSAPCNDPSLRLANCFGYLFYWFDCLAYCYT